MLLALIAYADANGFDSHAWQISWTLGPFLNRRGRWQDYTATQQTALAAASRLGDTLALAQAGIIVCYLAVFAKDAAPSPPAPADNEVVVRATPEEIGRAHV